MSATPTLPSPPQRFTREQIFEQLAERAIVMCNDGQDANIVIEALAAALVGICAGHDKPEEAFDAAKALLQGLFDDREGILARGTESKQ
jgi:DNA-binding NarL/FixJ family response regulator